jgi:DNA-binding NtrC family response regulator
VIVVHSPDDTCINRAFVALQGLSIGRSSDGDVNICVNDRLASRLHARIERRANQWFVIDDDSRNGTFVEGQRIRETEIEPQTLIRVGDTLLVFTEISTQQSDLGSSLLGQSAAMEKVRGEIQKIAATMLPILVTGETGTGKEVVAGALHRLSGRPGPLLAVNCAAIPEGLSESAFFGHEKGAFTDAGKETKGYWRSADHGTLFLDEFGDLPTALQPKLLRLLDSGEFLPVGAAQTQRSDVRLVAATNIDLNKKVDAGEFRRDLLARVCGFVIALPPVRERREDILLLLSETWRAQQRTPQLTTECAERLLRYRWPMNVREIKTLATRLGLASEKRITLEDLPPDFFATSALIAVAQERREGPDRDEFVRILQQYAGNISAIATHYSRERKQIYRWLEKFEISLVDFRDPEDGSSP